MELFHWVCMAHWVGVNILYCSILSDLLLNGWSIVIWVMVCLLVWFDSLRLFNNLSVKQGRVFLGWTSTKLWLMCLAQGPQRSDAGEARTRGLSVSSQALYHWATALPIWVIVTLCQVQLAMWLFNNSLSCDSLSDEYSVFLWLLVTYCQMNMQDFHLSDDPLIVEYSGLQPVKLTIIRREQRVSGQPADNQDYRWVNGSLSDDSRCNLVSMTSE